MPVINSAAALYRLPAGTRLTVRWPATGKTAQRTFLRKQGRAAVFATDAGGESYLPLTGAAVTAAPGGFDVSWPGDPGATACEYRFVSTGSPL